MKKTFITLITLITLSVTISSCTKVKDPEPTVPKVPVAAMLSLTGNWSTLGVASKAALEIAEEDINKYLDDKNAGFNIVVGYADTKLDTTQAKLFFTSAKNNGIPFLIGPQSSAELAAIKPLVDKSEVIVISQSSTAGSLAIPGDNIFRYCPSDKIEGDAIAKTIYDSGIRGLVTVARDDAGNKGLQGSTGSTFITLGGEVGVIPPYSTTTTDYSGLVIAIKAEVARLTAIHGADKVAVYLAGFDECKDIFKEADIEPTLKAAKWFGGDGVVQSAAITGDAVAAEFAIATEFFAPSYGLSAAYQAKWKPISDRIKAKTGAEPDAFALVTYDALWTIAHTVEKANSTTAGTFTQFKELFTSMARQNDGITGPNTLNAAGDRANGTFDYWGITKTGTTYSWVLKGKSGE